MTNTINMLIFEENQNKVNFSATLENYSTIDYCVYSSLFLDYGGLFFRSNFIFGMVVPRELVAFSDPTLDGKEFAKHYMKNKLLIY